MCRPHLCAVWGFQSSVTCAPGTFWRHQQKAFCWAHSPLREQLTLLLLVFVLLAILVCLTGRVIVDIHRHQGAYVCHDSIGLRTDTLPSVSKPSASIAVSATWRQVWGHSQKQVCSDKGNLVCLWHWPLGGLLGEVVEPSFEDDISWKWGDSIFIWQKVQR